MNDTSLHNLKANSLVRYRCMIQDMYDPEFYLGKYEVKDTATGNTFLRSGKYKDVAECGVNYFFLLYTYYIHVVYQIAKI